MALLAGACDLKRAPVLDPKGPIALAERDLLFDAFYVMMLVIVPIIILTLWFAWRYRASNTKAKYTPTWANSVTIDAITWLIPAVIVIAVAVLLWRSTHRLDPYRPLESKEPPFDVQVVAQDWKWLFIYPEQGIAVVNQLAFPAGRPVSLRITSDTVMNSFYVPQLAGQIYAMAGMQTRLQMLADQPGKFVGRNSQYSGGGYSEQHFEVLAMTPADFDAWVARAKQSGRALDAAAYTALAAKSRANPITYYSTVEPKLFDSIIDKYRHSGHAQHAPARR
ncbi:ubiquinol oxidase subunit II [uncultured Reyranella sp.]|uniref:ubiquinol oxidase subunit II n=1 Tax=uncultured Reyranella sp. TaxID=735512 RepID=UPI00259CE0A5|nr:ubiquinol oxidase subunit II [uncultured Reyranella sp.]